MFSSVKQMMSLHNCLLIKYCLRTVRIIGLKFTGECLRKRFLMVCLSKSYVLRQKEKRKKNITACEESSLPRGQETRRIPTWVPQQTVLSTDLEQDLDLSSLNHINKPVNMAHVTPCNGMPSLILPGEGIVDFTLQLLFLSQPSDFGETDIYHMVAGSWRRCELTFQVNLRNRLLEELCHKP